MSIDFGPHKYTAVSDQMAERIAKGRLPLSAKVWFACLTGMNNWGHAYFYQDELSLIVYGKLPTRGMRSTIAEKIKQFRDDGWIAPESTINCVVLDADYFQRGRGRGSLEDECRESMHRGKFRQRWSSSRLWHAGDDLQATGNHMQPTGKRLQATGKRLYDIGSDLDFSPLEDIEDIEDLDIDGNSRNKIIPEIPAMGNSLSSAAGNPGASPVSLLTRSDSNLSADGNHPGPHCNCQPCATHTYHRQTGSQDANCQFCPQPEIAEPSEPVCPVCHGDGLDNDWEPCPDGCPVPESVPAWVSE